MSTLASLVGLAGLAAALAAAPDGCGDRTDPPVARIAVERPAMGSDLFLLTALHEGSAGEAMTYRLTVLREGTAGRSQSAQSGPFTPGGGVDTLSTMRVNAGPGDRIEAELTLSRGATTVARDTFTETVATP